MTQEQEDLHHCINDMNSRFSIKDNELLDAKIKLEQLLSDIIHLKEQAKLNHTNISMKNKQLVEAKERVVEVEQQVS